MNRRRIPMSAQFFPRFVVRKGRANVRIYDLACAGLVGVIVAGCNTPSAIPARVAKPEAPLAPHLTPEEATTANAAAKQCSSSSPVDVASIAAVDAFAVGFGERGGLVAWSSSSGIQGRVLDAGGHFLLSAMNLSLPNDAKPIEIAPLGQGFVVIAQRVETQNSLCEGRCIDATCSGWPAGSPQPHICSSSCPKPCVIPLRHEFFLRYVDLGGKNIGGQKSWTSGLVGVEAVLHGDGRSLGILTGNEIVWVQTDDVLGLVMKREKLPLMTYALPIRGRGKPSLLAVAEDGSVRLVDAAGEHPLQGSIGDGRSGRILDARLQARWDTNDQLHIAKQAWMTSLDSIQYSFVDQGIVHTRDESERGVFRAPFAEYVEPHFEAGRFRRRSWLQRSIGEDIDLQAVDPAADVRRAQFVWTGKTFLFVYPLVTTPQNLRGIVFQCGDPASKPG